MTDIRKAAEQALEALEARCGTNAEERQDGGAITALRAALSQPAEAKGEPVAWRFRSGLNSNWVLSEKSAECVREFGGGWEAQPLYPHPAAQPVGREALSRQTLIGLWGDKSDGPSNSEIVDFGRAVERAHGITGEGI